MRTLFIFGAGVLLVTSLILLAKFNDRFLVEIPQHGSALTEGIIGRPRFINPVMAKSDADRDMSELIYSGLMKATPEGDLIPDLAESYVVSEDGLTYTFTLRNELVWHDGTPITSNDIAYTIEKVRDPGLAIKSPRRASWEGVEVATPDARTVVFTIKQPYAPFLENTTMGILPKHVWQNVPDEEFDVTYHNIDPIGSGPYRLLRIVRDDNKGLPSYYDLRAFQKYALGEPYITDLRISFFGNNNELTDAYNNHSIDQMHTIEPAEAKVLEATGAHIARAPLPRIFAAYFNQNQQVLFTDKTVRRALDTAIDKDAIVQSVLLGYGKSIDGPIPFPEFDATTTGTSSDRIADAKAMLEEDGWAPNASGIYEKVNKKKKTVTQLEFSIAVPDVAELKAAAEMVQADWQKMGANVTLKVFESSTFTSDVLSPRKYDVLFYGQIIGRTPDPYAYWHSSQRNAPGLNVSLYANKNVDKLLEDARKEHDPAKREELLTQFVEDIREDIPAIFIYSPDFLYATSGSVRGMHMGILTTESERFLDVHDWYINSERVWKWFAERQAKMRP